jgi:hypothetical protein
MSYPFSTHWFCFTDREEAYQNYFENVSGQTIQYNTSSIPVSQIVDTILDAYAGINSQLGYDYDGSNTSIYKAYAAKYLSSTSAKESDVYIVLGTVESGLAQVMITSPILKIHGAIANGTQGLLAKTESVLSDVATGTGTVLENLGVGIVNTSSVLSNLPLIIGIGAAAYYFLMVAPKSKKGS